MVKNLREACAAALESISFSPILDFLDSTGTPKFDLIRASMSDMASVQEKLVLAKVEEAYANYGPRPEFLTPESLLLRLLANRNATREFVRSLRETGEMASPGIYLDHPLTCVSCGVIPGKRKMFCSACVEQTTPRQRWAWYTTANTVEIARDYGLIRFFDEVLKELVGQGFPANKIAAKIPKSSPIISGIRYTPEMSKLHTLLVREDDEGFTDFLVTLIEGVPARELSDPEILDWAQNTEAYKAREVLPGREVAEELADLLGHPIKLNLLELAKSSWPSARELEKGLVEADAAWLSLTLKNSQAKKLFAEWDKPSLFDFRRALNLEDMELLKTADWCNQDFLSNLASRGLTLRSLKKEIVKVNYGFSDLLGHAFLLDSEMFLAWMAATDYPDMKFELVLNPPKEFLQLQEQYDRQIESSIISGITRGSERNYKNPHLNYWDPINSAKEPKPWRQRSWKNRWAP